MNKYLKSIIIWLAILFMATVVYAFDIHTGVAPGSNGDILVNSSGQVGNETATGTGAPVRATNPVLVGPALGTPASGTLTNCTGLPASGVSGTAALAGVNNDITSMTGLDNDGIPLAKVASAASDGVNADITSMTGLDNDGIPLAKVASAASDGVNADITSMTGLDNDGIPLAKVANAASDGANSDITSLAGITTPLSVAQGGTGIATIADGGLMIGNAAGDIEADVAGLTTEILVGGGALTKPVWTTATGTGAPVRAVDAETRFKTVEVAADTRALTAAECSNLLITNRGWDGADDQTITFPDVDTLGAGLKIKFESVVDSGGTADTYFDAEGTTTKIILNGVAGGDGERIWIEEIAKYNSIVCHTITEDGTTYDWVCDSCNGVWLPKGS